MFGLETFERETEEEFRYFFESIVQSVRPACPAYADYYLECWFARGSHLYREIQFAEGEMSAAIFMLAHEVGLSRRLISCARMNGTLTGFEIVDGAIAMFDYSEIEVIRRRDDA